MIAFLLLLAGAAVAAPANPSADRPAEDDLSRVDVRGTTASIEAIAEQIRALSPADRAEATASLRFLTENDAYTRTALQLPFALHAVVDAIDPERLDRFVRHDWTTLQRGLSVHVAVLQDLGFDPPAPSTDPLVPTLRAIELLPGLAERVDSTTKEQIDEHSARVEKLTGVARPCSRQGPWAILPGQPWTLGMQLGGWHDALRRMQPFVTDPEVAARIDAMIQTLEAYGDHSQ